jgi:broad specificity phosphatase PhoE
MAERRALYRAGLIVLIIVGLCVVVWWCWWCGRSSATLLIVRHAERVAGQDALSAAGQARAQVLAHVVERAELAGIYHSDTVRTRQTAEPAATALGITPVELPANDIEALIDHINANHRGATVLVVGHSNTVPLIISEAGGPTIPNLPDGEFDNLFVLERCRCWWQPAKLTNLQYGVESP